MFIAVAVQSGVILLREGLEAVVVLLAVASVVRRVAPHRLAALWWGAWLGVVVSAVMALSYAAWFVTAADSGVARVASLLAAALMLWVGGWLWRQADPWRWNGAVEHATLRALAARHGPSALAIIGFLAAFREGAETTLFLSALGREASAAALLSGVVVAGAILALLWQVSLRTAIRLPVRLLFRLSSVVMLVSAVQLAAAGLQRVGE